jgi:L-alanine-DL-glutamate epimerase-like enolase superfamily enzyme
VTCRSGGVTGFGSAPLYKRPFKTLFDIWRDLRPWLISENAEDVAELRQRLNLRYADRYSSLLYAVDGALWDMEGRLQSRSVAELLGTIRRERIPLTLQSFIEDSIVVVEQVQSLVARGVTQFKLKIGTSVNADIDMVKQVRTACGDAVTIKLDGNGCYQLEEALVAGKAFADLGVSLWEEPLAWTSWSELRTLRSEVPLPLMLDESCQTRGSTIAAIENDALDVLNVKLTRVGGLTQAQSLVALCDSAGVGVSIGCSEDLGAAMAAIIHLSATVENLVGTEGIGWERLGFDSGSPSCEIGPDGSAKVSTSPGLGVEYDAEALAEASSRLGFEVHQMDGGVNLRWLAESVRNGIVRRWANRN